MRALLLCLVVACDAGKKPSPPPPAPAPPAPAAPHSIDAAVVVDALTPDAAVVEHGVKPPANNGFVDDPPWPDDQSSLVLTFIVWPPSVPDKRDPQWLLAPVTLEASMSTYTRRIELAPQFGNLSPIDQPFCNGVAYPLGKNDVAEITFYEGGAGGYLVRRKSNDILSVLAWEQGDGACPGPHGEPTACPRSERAVFRMHIPARAKVYYTIALIDEQGNRSTFDCTR